MNLNKTRRDFGVWIGLCVGIGLLALLYLSVGLQAADDEILMPLDDTYIHFQYARQMSIGQPYVYHTGDAASSGATSFLYSPLLAIGHFIGFRELNLAIWALGMGSLAFLFSAWLIYRLIVDAYPAPSRLQYAVAIIFTLVFVSSGPFIWASFSGMETALFIMAILLALYCYSHTVQPLFATESLVIDHAAIKRYAIPSAVLVALIRPEGAVVALSMVVAIFWTTRRLKAYLLLPLGAVLLQPTLNWAITGHFSAAGSAAKSHLSNSSISFIQGLEHTWDNWLQIWRELFSGHNAVDGAYVSGALVVMGLAFAGYQAVSIYRYRKITPPVLIMVSLVGLSIAVATLETAFWHFKRYQLPLMVLFFPLAGWALSSLSGFLAQSKVPATRYLSILLALIPLYAALPSTLEYARRYGDNIAVVKHQQIAMARWVAENLPEDVRVGVHDVGIMAYVGQRPTYDLVGLTTADVATAWRQGSGAIYDTMLARDDRPNYFAIYHDIQSLPLLEQAGVFGEELARFSFPLPSNTVAAATETQIVSRANWPSDFSSPRQSPILAMLPDDAVFLGELNVGDIAQETAANYEWWNQETRQGFATIARRLDYAACEAAVCRGVDGTRLLTGGESFDLPPNSANAYWVILRVHAQSPAKLQAGCDGRVQDANVVPNRAGEWVEMVFIVPSDSERFCLEVEGQYEAATYWIYGAVSPQVEIPAENMATFYEPQTQTAFYLNHVDYRVEADRLLVDARWFSAGNLTQDGKVFVHVYDDPNEPPLRQVDVWPQADILPPANWVAGFINDHYQLDISGLAVGTYQVALGFYEPTLQIRYTLDADGTDRLFLGEVTIH